MYDDASSLWQAALKVLSSQLSRANYDTWLEGTAGVHLEDDVLTIGTRSEFVTEWLHKRLRPSILRTLAELQGHEITIRFEPLRGLDHAVAALQDVGEPIIRPSMPRPRLRERYTFAHYIVGPGNRLAFAAAEGVARDPGHLYNPLFLYGAAGLGKTHLLHAIGHDFIERGMQVVYLSAEAFTNQLITAIQQRRMDDFRSRYRSADALLVDDIQFIAGKEQTQEEFFYTFNELYEAGRQIVISSDKSPAHISQLEDRLRTRFEWGMIADLQAPDIETRVAILRHKAQEQNIRVRDDVLHAIAARFKNNIRELEGSLTRVIAYSRLTGESLTPDLVHSALASLETSEPKLPPSPELIIDMVCRYFEIDRTGLLSVSREKRVAYPRQIAMYLMRELAHRSLVEIGNALGGRDHSTVHHGWRKMERSLSVDPEARRDIASLRELIEQSRRSA
ncbi:MAG: chromosomal replication initiator protein DnaA [Chloroflexi bacterium]|nr:chromosomal replication initiator protein DnaA [Chloroflexota bacterium]MDA1240256.1 chromosomal replication initiator protein DnaA [Chloroflexota bacterium]MQC19066.1 chromosomal replication initiator protein DnaA [Chloroflexota bacterium]